MVYGRIDHKKSKELVQSLPSEGIIQPVSYGFKPTDSSTEFVIQLKSVKVIPCYGIF